MPAKSYINAEPVVMGCFWTLGRSSLRGSHFRTDSVWHVNTYTRAGMKHFWMWPLLASYLPTLGEEILGKELLKRREIPSSLDWFEEVWFSGSGLPPFKRWNKKKRWMEMTFIKRNQEPGYFAHKRCLGDSIVCPGTSMEIRVQVQVWKHCTLPSN